MPAAERGTGMAVNLSQDVHSAISKVLREGRYQFIALAVSLLFLALYVYVPLAVTPGNDFAFFLETTEIWQFALLIILAMITGVIVSMQSYLFARKREIAEGAPTIVSGIVSFSSGLFSSATCASCVSVIFAFLGTSGVLFLLKYRWHLAIISFMLLAVALVFVSGRIMNHCKSCEIPVKKRRKRK